MLLLFLSACTPAGQTQQKPAATIGSSPATVAPVRTPAAIAPHGPSIFAFSAAIEGQYDIYLGNSDGSLLRRLTDDPGRDTCPLFSPDGTRIAFCSDRTGKDQLFIMNDDGSAQALLTDQVAGCSCGPDRPMAWSPDGKWISFAVQMGGTAEKPAWDLFIASADGSTAVNLTQSPGTIFSFSWNHDSRSVLYGATGSVPDDLYRVDIESKKVTPFSSQPIRGIPAGFSSDGAWLLYWVFTSGSGKIFTVPAGGGNPLQLTYGSGSDSYPAWTSNGQRIIFMRTQDQDHEIYTMNVDGSGQVNLSSNPQGNDLWPSSSLDGQKILYVTQNQVHWDTVLMNSDGSGKTSVTDAFNVVHSISWQP